MKRFLMPAPALATLLVLVLLPAIAFAQNPTSGALLEIDGTVTIGSTNAPVHLKVYDSQIHTGVVAVPALNGSPNTNSNCFAGDEIPTDAYLLQAGAATGCDQGDGAEVNLTNLGHFTFKSPAGSPVAYEFDISTQYVCGPLTENGSACNGPNFSNTNGNINAFDTGFLTVLNNGTSTFSGTIKLSGQPGNPTFCGSSVLADTVTSALGLGASVVLALSNDSSACGGFNMPISSANLTQPLAAGQTSIFPFGKDDYQITPLNSLAGDTLDVLPVPVPAGPLGLNTWGVGNFGSETPVSSPLRFSAGSNFAPTTYACIPYADFSAPNNPVCVELHLTPGGTEDGGGYLYTATNDFNIDANSLPGGVGGPSFLGHHAVSCPDSGFDINIFFSYTAPSTTFGDPIKGSGSGTGSCWVAAFDPNAAAIPTGQTFSSFVGFQTPVANSPDLNIVKAGSGVPLIWQQFISPGVPLTTLSLCPGPLVPNSGTCPSAPALSPPWVFVATIRTTCNIDSTPTTDPTVVAGASGLQNFGNGTYQYNWKTVKGLTGCVDIVLIYDSGLTLFPANFKYK